MEKDLDLPTSYSYVIEEKDHLILLLTARVLCRRDKTQQPCIG